MEQAYLALLQELLDRGHPRRDRTGVGTRALFGRQLRFDLRVGFPLLTTKKVFVRGVVEELLWFLAGETRVQPLQAKGVRIWDEWASAEQCARFGRSPGDLGPIYGHQWRNFGATKLPDGTYARDGVDQISNLLEQLKSTPESRRMIVTGWNPREASAVALPPCHTLFQCFVADGELSTQLYQRSGDVFLGVPFNIASYALLTCMLAHVVGLRVGEFVHTFGDVHLYENHVLQAREQLARQAKLTPALALNPDIRDLFAFRAEDITVLGYDPHPAIQAAVAI